MAGTLFGLGLMPQFDASGNLARGALLYLYSENTSTPVTAYSDFALSSALTWPIVADGAGRLPAFWLADGSYRARLTTSAGIEIFDEQSITAIGSGSGGSTSSSQDSTTLFQTGYFLFDPVQTSLSGFVRANALTIGSGSSGATERANSDTQSLFEYLWANFSDSDCPVSTGRGATATADFNANKTIGLPDFRDCVVIGRSGMGNTSSGLISDTLFASVGATTRTIAQANLPNVNFYNSSGTLLGPSHTHTAGTFAVGTTITNGSGVGVSLQAQNDAARTGSGAYIQSASSATLSLASGAVSGTSASSGTGAVTGTVSSGGSGTALSIIPKGRVGNWFIKL